MKNEGKSRARMTTGARLAETDPDSIISLKKNKQTNNILYFIFNNYPVFPSPLS